MSQAIELPDAVYTALKRAADSRGLTPEDWIAAQLPDAKIAMQPKASALADSFQGRVGRVRSGGQEILSERCGEKFADYVESKKREGCL